MPAIPQISLADLESGGADRVSRAFDEAYGTVGFAHFVDHGIPVPVVEQAFRASRQFHAMPDEEKRRISVNRHHRGYIAPETSTDRASGIEAARYPNVSESFIKLSPPPPSSRRQWPLHGPNQWPDLDGFRETIDTFETAAEALARRLVGIVATALRPDPRPLLAAFEHPTAWLRLLHYPPAQANRSPDRFGSAPHTDFGCLTLLFQDDAGGLQVQTPDGDWIDAPPVPGAILVNTGDIIPVWSGGRWRSTPHRVVNPQGRDRYSIAYFFDPAMDTAITPPDDLPDDPTTRKSFKSFRFGDHVMAQLDAAYDYRNAGA